MKKITFPTLLIAATLALVSFSQLSAQTKEGNEMAVIGKGTKADSILKEKFPAGSRHEFVMVPMRDGTKLATDVFIPPGNGPWSVVFGRGYYGRLNSAAPKEAQGGEFVYICQDARGAYDSEGKGAVKPTSPDSEINDTADALKWITTQKWCNGKIGMIGASGNGVGPMAGFLAKDPHLIVSCGTISSPWPYYYWGFHNGVRRMLYGWLSHAGLAVQDWPKPTVPSYDLTHWKEVLSTGAKDNSTVLVISGGWYDISPEAVLDTFAAGASTSKIFASIAPGGHGGHCPVTWPQKKSATQGIVYVPSVTDILLGKGKIPEKSQLTYYVMGNFRDPSSPGNCYKVTSTWPVPNTPTSFYFHADGSLSTTKPSEASASKGYDYNPKDPAPSLEIDEMLKSGPFDQRPLKDRKDVLHFTSAPLNAPLAFTGKVFGDLYVSTDVPDTEFVVKLIDIQPDGYEMMIRESAILGRYAEEFQDKPAPLEKGKVYHLKIDLRSTAIILDKGHRLGVLVTSSTKPEYEVHPNSFEPVMNFDNSPVAHQTIHLSSKYPSSVIVPVVPADKE